LRVTKYRQSCLLLEKGSGRLLVDLGTLATEVHALEDFGEVQAVLYTHRHADHLDERCVDQLLDRGVELYGNADVCSVIGDAASEVRDGEELELAGFRITPRDLTHVPLVDGSAGPPNTGFLFDGRLFHPGDGINLPGLSVDILAAPIAGPSISFRDAYAFTKQTGAGTVVPIHYDFFIADPEMFSNFCDIAEVIVLGDGESADL
jgi:L-ascorbate metabolism protein UlaG (beta-lactamase superfamily)